MTKVTQPAENSPLLFIVGPTAVGKTALSLDLAEALGAEILSCDAYCVYRGMEIGTAKPTAAERARVPHRGVDLVEVATPFSIEHYLAEAGAALTEAKENGVPLVVAGGSGFYLKSFFAPVMDAVEIPAEVPARVAAIENEAGLSGLREALRPFIAGEPEAVIDWDNPRRLTKALERSLATGKTVEALREDFASQPPPFSAHSKTVFLLERDREELHQRIALRVDQMLAEGLVDEVRALRAEGLEENPTASAAIGYRETLAYLRGEVPSLEALREEIVVHTRQLARKQITWFRRQIPVHHRIPAASATVADCLARLEAGP